MLNSKEPSILFVRKIFWQTNISNSLIRTHTCVYRGKGGGGEMLVFGIFQMMPLDDAFMNGTETVRNKTLIFSNYRFITSLYSYENRLKQTKVRKFNVTHTKDTEYIITFLCLIVRVEVIKFLFWINFTTNFCLNSNYVPFL